MAVKASIRAVKSSVLMGSVVVVSGCGSFSAEATLPVRHGTDDEELTGGGGGAGKEAEFSAVTGVVVTRLSLML
jgi:hypothetical protein